MENLIIIRSRGLQLILKKEVKRLGNKVIGDEEVFSNLNLSGGLIEKGINLKRKRIIQFQCKRKTIDMFI